MTKKRLAEARPFYEEGGRAIGRKILHDPEAEPQLWKLVEGLGLWKRWYLRAFCRLYSAENPTEYERVRKQRYRKMNSAIAKAEKIARLRKEATESVKKPGSLG